MPTGLVLSQLKVGMVVMFIDARLNTHPLSFVKAPYVENLANLAGVPAMVVALTDEPGKRVGLAMKTLIPLAHSCDGRVPQGHGVWALPEHLYTVEAYAQHQALAAKVTSDQNSIATMLQGFLVAAPTTPPVAP